MLSIGKKSFFFRFSTHFPNSWQVQISFFSIIFPIVQTQTPPHQCCWENVKKCQNFTYGYFDENSKNMIINRKTSKWKIFRKKRTYRDFDKNFQKFANHLRVKPLDTRKKGLFLGGGLYHQIFFFNFGDMILIQNMKNIKSKFWIDLEYFSQHLVNTSRFRGKWNLRILENS